MVEVTDAMVEAVARRAATNAGCVLDDEWKLYENEVRGALTAYAEITAALSARETEEPVAWRVRYFDNELWEVEAFEPSTDDPSVSEVQSLFAHPAADASREAIRREAFEEAAKVVTAEASKWMPGGPFDVKGFCRRLAAAIRARGA